MKKYDFSGWATRNDIRCSDGRIIRQGAFKDCDGSVVPLVWNHDHNDPNQVLGHVLLENRNEGVYAYGSFNDTAAGQNAKQLVEHGDIVSMSIYANKLSQRGSDVLHGAIREVSLVLAGANPGAMIESVIRHGEMSDDEAVIYTGEDLELSHADDSKADAGKADDNKTNDEGDKNPMPNNSNKTVQDVFNELTEEQKQVVYFLIGNAVEDAKGGNDEEDDVKHNVFDQDDNYQDNFLSHSEMAEIFSDAKRGGSLKDAVIEHGIEEIDWLFPEPKGADNPPAWITRPQEWVKTVMSGVHHTPFSRVKSMFANLTEDEARARGYIKGNLKKEQVFSLLRRSTLPKTIYKVQKLDRDDVIDITDFDVVAWIKGEMRGQLDEELARAILVGDGREASDEAKIDELNIRPIWTDADLFTIKAFLQLPQNTTPDQKAKAFIRSCVKARKDYKGAGNPVLFTTEDLFTDMLLLEDLNGRIIYDSEAKLATALRVSKIVTVPILEGLTRTVDGTERTLDGIIVNLSDYGVGADKGGAVNMFDDFNIDYNKHEYLIETRCSGALRNPFSAIAIEHAVTSVTNVTLTVGTVTEAFIQAHELGYTTHRTGTPQTDTFTGTGSQKNFTLTKQNIIDNVVDVTVNGEVVSSDAYTVSGTTLSFGTAPENGAEIVAKYLYNPYRS